MPHVAFVPFTGLRVCDPALRELGFSLPGLRRRGAALAELPALGLLTLAGMLPKDWTCSYHTTDQKTVDELVDEIISSQPSLVAISALTASIIQAYHVSQMLRAAGIQVVIGGLHATACAEEAQRYCDAVVVGDGEPVWPEILADSLAGGLRPLYSSRDRSPKAIWPTPRFDLLGRSAPRYTLQTQRGCPLACDFCAASRLLGPFREKPLEAIERELFEISRIDPRPLIELADDNTFAGDRDIAAFCNALSKSGARWFTESDWRIGDRPELLTQIAAAGCVQILVGIESLNFRYPGMGAKLDSLARVMDAVAAIQDSGIAVNGCLILGAEGETHESIDRLLQFVLDSPFADVQLTLQTPFPGTQLHKRLHQQGRLLVDRDWSHYTLLDVTYQPDQLSVAQLEQAFRNAVGEIYSKEATARRDKIRRQVWHRNPTLHKQKG